MITIYFENKSAKKKTTMIKCDHASLDDICMWYAAYHAGDNYEVYAGGHKRVLDGSGVIIGFTSPPDIPPT